MKKYNSTEIEDIALRYAYNKKSLTQKNDDVVAIIKIEWEE